MGRYPKGIKPAPQPYTWLPSMFLIHFKAWACGSIISAHLKEEASVRRQALRLLLLMLPQASLPVATSDDNAILSGEGI